MIIFDIEASGLSSQSYPIEIAWQDSSNKSLFDTFLIKPPESWHYWDDYAENEIHHISREMLLKDGITIDDASERLNSQLSGETIYSDAIDYDKRWMLRLFNETNITPSFSFGSVYDVANSSEIEAYTNRLENEEVQHRALEDARQIIRLLSL